MPWRRRSKIELTLPPEPEAPRPRLLPAELLRRLEFRVIRRLDGFLFGDYRGFFYGPSLDLAEVREYQPGDEVRRIDWNVTARTGKLHIRQYREEKEVTVWLIVDLTASMNFGTRRALKAEVALEFAGVAAAIAARHGDRVGALGFSEAGLRLVPPGVGRRQVLRLLRELLPLTRGGRGGEGLEGALEHAARIIRRRALLFVVSDFLSPQEEPPWAASLRRLAHRHDVVAVRVLDPAELELPDGGELRLRDPESGEEVWLDTSDPRVRRAYRALVQAREAELERIFRSARVDTLVLSTAKDMVEPLLKFTLRRRGQK
ncbi:DUF58 domain-containing protein [Meiothermus sp. QL-1]|uniref:DUF58 domain-containing protein n=1 Tax=Meiothermus sp. QL-1 TaxID=2058095 RepID=UPI000E0A2299|nr:DUF58 domain-containing protein [Meiothermus sp. QL-1]RDI95506.1 DUF58 domain-containing protein [Meiothermus sp. QL-1]